MLRSYLKIALRNLTRHSFYATINIFGLALGMAAGFLILQYVHYELSYDSFWDNKENIFRAQTDRYNNGEISTQWAAGASGIGYYLNEEFPEVDSYVVMHVSGAEISYDREYYDLEFPYYASEDFFKVFSVPLIKGIDSLVLKDPFTVVVSETTASKMFGEEDPVGKIIKTNDVTEFKVTGVFQDLPLNSHMQFDLLYSFESYKSLVSENAGRAMQWDGFLNYIKLYPGTDVAALEEKIPDFVERLQGEELRQYNAGVEYPLQPLEKIHLISDYRGEIKPTGDERATYFLMIIGLFVLLIAWINYINLTTARSMSRAREVGIRKVMGSFKSQLVRQFMLESIVINLLALFLATAIVIALFPFFNDFIGRPVSYTWPADAFFWVGLISFFATGIFLSGFYPAMVLSRFKPVAVLKGKFSGSASGSLLRKGLVTVQFLASIILITGTFIVYRQMNFLQNQDLGVNIEQTLVIETPNYSSDSVYVTKDNVFRNQLQVESSVQDVTITTAVPGRTPGWNAGGIRLINQTEAESNQYRVMGGDDEFVDFFGLEILAGRKFDGSFGTEEENVIFNEAAAKRMGFADIDEIINKKIFFWGDTFNVIGVVKNYRQESPKQAYDAIIFRYFNSASGFYSVRLNTQNMRQSLDQIQDHWGDAFGSKQFNYFFLDDFYNEQYKAELKFGSIFGIFSGLAIIVACLGLFGLASYITSLRSKEVGVRKVLGASVQQLWTLLTTDFLRLVGVSVVISVPVTYFVMKNWLDNFANRIDMGVVTFLIPALILLLISVATVSYHTLKTAQLNPAKTLKEE